MSSSTTHDAWSPTKYQINADFVPLLGGSVMFDMLAVQPHERVLDLGCGDGVLTKKLESLCARVIGVDASPAMIEAARDQVGCSDVRVVDGHDLREWFERAEKEEGLEKFDAVFSNAALHWMKKNPRKVVEGVKRILKPGGRFVAECGGFMNVGEIHVALITALNRRGFDGKALSPWYFPSAESYSDLLASVGFTVKHISLNPRPTELTTDVAGWIETFGFSFLSVLKPQDREAVIQEVVEHLRPGYQREDGKWFVMYVRLRVVAVLE
ncbi:S-adenosyl-L-methionine-dependent methyltransferase [Jimgerdemannia flammicorona]|uniref:S-adenosyl-L-methionine-dependent methyltransferase n=1 Tax=Jimgerdemannia flammicorona TaxID=994334 RepID=A0A433Q3C0_9FUNG|nr:S-adenosyl-L-methionine-dependent methyltransferase [Jimgerdemannia flammicorona]